MDTLLQYLLYRFNITYSLYLTTILHYDKVMRLNFYYSDGFNLHYHNKQYSIRVISLGLFYYFRLSFTL